MINLLAYEDAASVVIAALEAGRRPPSTDSETSSPVPTIKGRVFLAADDEPTSRRRICELAMTHPCHAWKALPEFNSEGPGAGATKVYDTSVTRRDLEWEPKYKSFTDYFLGAVEVARHEKQEWEQKGGSALVDKQESTEEEQSTA